MDSKPKFLEYSSQQENSENFFAFLDYLEKNPIDYGHTYASLHDEIKAKKCPCKEIPSLQDLRQYFYCFLNYKKSNRSETILKYWNKKHLSVLIFLFTYIKHITNLHPDEYGDQQWIEISKLLPYTSPESLKYKWLSLRHRTQTFQNFWSLKDDYILMEIIYENEPLLLDPKNSLKIKLKWSTIAMKFNHRSKNNKLGKHCKERWFNHLCPHLNKTVWTDQEDILLLENSIIHNKKWAKIAHSFPGRTQHNVKNRFLSLIAREHKISSKKLSFKESCSKSLILTTLCNLKRRFSFTLDGPYRYVTEPHKTSIIEQGIEEEIMKIRLPNENLNEINYSAIPLNQNQVIMTSPSNQISFSLNSNNHLNPINSISPSNQINIQIKQYNRVAQINSQLNPLNQFENFKNPLNPLLNEEFKNKDNFWPDEKLSELCSSSVAKWEEEIAQAKEADILEENLEFFNLM